MSDLWTHEENPYKVWYWLLHHIKLQDWDERFQQFAGSATELPFDQWWENVREGFEPLPPFLCRTLESKEEAEQWSAWDVDEVGLKEAVLLVSLDYPLETVLPEVERQLRALKQARMGRPERQVHAEWPLARKPNMRVINKIMDVWLMRESGELLWKVAENLNLAPQADSATADGMNVLTATASRYVHQAETMAENALLGRFPVY